ncbi:MAG: NfeD family protein [Dermatophilaceae bacterium]
MFEDPAWLAWVGVALVLGAVEMATVDFTFLMLAGGALGGGAAAALGAPLPIQALVAAVTACLLLVGVRPWAKRRFSPHGPRHVMGTAAHVGRTAYVVQTVTRTTGQIRLGGEILVGPHHRRRHRRGRAGARHRHRRRDRRRRPRSRRAHLTRALETP